MNIKKHPIWSSDDRRLCHISYSDNDQEWKVHTGDITTITVLTLSPMSGVYAQLEVPREGVVDDDEDMAYQLCTVDMGGEFCPVPDEKEHMNLCNRPICNATGKQICRLSLNEEDGTWSLIFYGKHYSTILYLYFNGGYCQFEILTEALK